MSYEELMAKALKGRSIRAMSKVWGVPPKTLDRYINAERIPDFNTALKIVKEAGLPVDEAFETLAAEERNHRSKQFKLQSGFVQNNVATLLALIAVVQSLYYVKCC